MDGTLASRIKALDAISNNNFKYTSGINRVHKISRDDTYKEMLIKKFNEANEWWDFYLERDKNYLSNIITKYER